MGVKSRIIDKATYRLLGYLQSEKHEISVVPTQGLFNCQCHNNCVQYAKDNEGVGIAEVIYVDNDETFLHYVNTKDGLYLETTLGWMAEKITYYHIRDIKPEEFEHLGDRFQYRLNHWTARFVRPLWLSLYDDLRIV